MLVLLSEGVKLRREALSGAGMRGVDSVERPVLPGNGAAKGESCRSWPNPLDARKTDVVGERRSGV
jgi:hypothetical protein